MTQDRGALNRSVVVELGTRSVRTVSERQPGGRRAAPETLALVQAFINSRWDLDRGLQEQLSSPQALADWLVDRDLVGPGTVVGRAGLRRALDVREGMRALLFANNGHTPDPDALERLNRALRGPGVFVQMHLGAIPEFRAAGRDLDAALAVIAAMAAAAQLDGSWTRLKACPGPHCGWAFYDHSRNQSGHWCAMSVCGSRTKAHDYRRRRRET